jgi:diadenosine tetraphosphate (Ap4A) HIT family hydrolase
MMPDGFDIGFDDVVHAAVHLVPRRRGDGLGEAAGAWVKDSVAL